MPTFALGRAPQGVVGRPAVGLQLERVLWKRGEVRLLGLVVYLGEERPQDLLPVLPAKLLDLEPTQVPLPARGRKPILPFYWATRRCLLIEVALESN